jgi:Asp-tRNA(Asn)/Glu-tRNA(Gln) amidotransferase B subunit
MAEDGKAAALTGAGVTTSARLVAKRLGLVQVQDTGALGGWVDEVLAAFPAEVARFRSGEAKLIGFFVGQVMKKSGGKADPKGVTPILQKKLKG